MHKNDGSIKHQKKKYGWIKSNKMDKGFFLYLHVDERIVFLNLTSLKQLWKKTVTSKKKFHLSAKKQWSIKYSKKKRMVELNTTKKQRFFLFALEETIVFLSPVFLEQLKKNNLFKKATHFSTECKNQ